MNFYNKIKDIAQKRDVVLFVDMDGVIASYEVNKPFDFLLKRPLKTNIEKIEQVSKIPNVELYMSRICFVQ